MPLFRALLLVQLGNAIGVWAHVVAVQWILTESGRSAVVVALAPAAMSVPFLLLALPMGVVVSHAARERLMAVAMGVSAAACGSAWVLAASGSTHPAALLATVVVVGTALVAIGVAWQSLLPETVPVPLIASAAALDGGAFNLARAAGPVLAGGGLAVAEPEVVFAGTTVLFALCSLSLGLIAWRRPGRRLPRRPLLPEMGAGLRFVRHSPWTRRLLWRMTVFGFPSSALWALVSVVAHDRLSLGSRDFGLLMAMLGLGALLATFFVAPLRAALGNNPFVLLGSCVYAAALVAMATLVEPVLMAGALLLAGIAWVGVQSTWMTLAH
ncbi:MAG: MFS transporter, partial [Herbiconiux sp.]|nr:MFS transporter [Herbiconiux sp.]